MIGSRTQIKVVKNKVAPPFREAEFDILYGSGISREGEMVDIGADMNVIEKLGAWYTYNGERIGQGRENARDLLRANPHLAEEIEAKIREKLAVKPVVLPEAAAEEQPSPEEEAPAPAPQGKKKG